MKKLAVLCLALLAGQANAQVTVSGSGEVRAVPNQATISLAVVTENEIATTALEQNNVSMEKALKTLTEMGITKGNIKTTELQVQPKYSKFKEGVESVITGYTVTNGLTITVRQIETVGKVMDAVVKDGVNRISGISFGFSDPTALLDQAREAAILDARHKAELFARGLNVKLGDVATVTEREVFRGYYTADSVRGASIASVEPGTQVVRVGINVVWNIQK